MHYLYADIASQCIHINEPYHSTTILGHSNKHIDSFCHSRQTILLVIAYVAIITNTEFEAFMISSSSSSFIKRQSAFIKTPRHWMKIRVVIAALTLFSDVGQLHMFMLHIYVQMHSSIVKIVKVYISIFMYIMHVHVYIKYCICAFF